MYSWAVSKTKLFITFLLIILNVTSYIYISEIINNFKFEDLLNHWTIKFEIHIFYSQTYIKSIQKIENFTIFNNKLLNIPILWKHFWQRLIYFLFFGTMKTNIDNMFYKVFTRFEYFYAHKILL